MSEIVDEFEAKICELTRGFEGASKQDIKRFQETMMWLRHCLFYYQYRRWLEDGIKADIARIQKKLAKRERGCER